MSDEGIAKQMTQQDAGCVSNIFLLLLLICILVATCDMRCAMERRLDLIEYRIQRIGK